MMRCRHLLILAVAFSGIRPAEAAEPAPSAPRLPVDAGRFTFVNPQLKAVFDGLVATSWAIAGDDWRHQPFRSLDSMDARLGYQAEWNSRGSLRGDETDRSPTHSIQVRAVPRLKPGSPTLIRIVAVSATLVPANGWGARVDFSTSGLPQTDQFELKLFQIGKKANRIDLDEEIVRRGLSVPFRRVGGEYVFDRLRYQYSALVPPVHSDHELVQALFHSPQRFRETVTDECDRLEQALRQRFAERTLISDFVVAAGWSPRDGAPHGPPPGTPSLTRNQEQLILEQALSKIDRPRSLIGRHFREMSAAAKRAFPLWETLERVDR